MKLNNRVYPNLLGACPPFQIDCNFDILTGVNEMLAQERDGSISLLPALPDIWKNGKISGLRVKGHTVDMEWHNGKLLHASVTKD